MPGERCRIGQDGRLPALAHRIGPSLGESRFGPPVTAARDDPTKGRRMDEPNDVIDLHAQASSAFARVLDEIPLDRLGDPTPCAGWDIRALVGHLTETHRGAAAAFSGIDPTNIESVPEGDDPRPAFAAAARDVRAAIRVPGALDRTVAMPWGESPGIVLARLLAADSAIHTWDLARAAGQPNPLDPALCESVLAFGHAMMKPEFRSPESGFGPEVAIADDASACNRMAAFFGRRP